MTPPPVSETAAWTEQDERHLQRQAADPVNSLHKHACEILRLRAENERLTKERGEGYGRCVAEPKCWNRPSTSRSRVSDNG